MSNRFRFPLFFLFIIVIVLGMLVIFPGLMRPTVDEAIQEASKEATRLDQLRDTIQRMGMAIILKIEFPAPFYFDMWDFQSKLLQFDALSSIRYNIMGFCVLSFIILFFSLLAFIFFFAGLFFITSLFSLITCVLHVCLLAFYFARVLGTYKVLLAIPIEVSYDADCIGVHLYIVSTILSLIITILSFVNYSRPADSTPKFYPKSTGDTYGSFSYEH